jgi:hypothetical protein
MPAIASELQLDIMAMLSGGEFGAALVRDASGRELVLKAMPGAEWAPRFARGAAISALVRSPEYPVPHYFGTGVAAGASWSLQERLAGDASGTRSPEHCVRPQSRSNASRRTAEYDANTDSVKLMTMHSSKGLEFRVVVIAGIGFLPYHANQAANDAKLLYVGMTRATERLLMTASRESDFVARLARWEATKERGLSN